jgi:RNA polymerase sigma factor (sigma-70 family)
MLGTIASTDDLAIGVLADAAAGDVAALEWIVTRHHAHMARVCVVICGGDEDLAEDAVQAAWPIALRKLGTVRDPARLRPWLIAIAVNEARQVIRRDRRRRVLEIGVGRAGGETDPAQAVGGIDLGLALRRLTADERTLLALRYVAGFDSVEIGRTVRLSPSGVRSRLERLLDRLRKELGDE